MSASPECLKNHGESPVLGRVHQRITYGPVGRILPVHRYLIQIFRRAILAQVYPSPLPHRLSILIPAYGVLAAIGVPSRAPAGTSAPPSGVAGIDPTKSGTSASSPSSPPSSDRASSSLSSVNWSIPAQPPHVDAEPRDDSSPDACPAAGVNSFVLVVAWIYGRRKLYAFTLPLQTLSPAAPLALCARI